MNAQEFIALYKGDKKLQGILLHSISFVLMNGHIRVCISSSHTLVLCALPNTPIAEPRGIGATLRSEHIEEG